jgi:glycerophosphoryl diester phosphodiesterase
MKTSDSYSFNKIKSVLIIGCIILSVQPFFSCQQRAKSSYEYIDLYKSDVHSRMRTLQLQTAITHPVIFFINNSSYDPEPIIAKISKLFDEAKSHKMSNWWFFIKEELSKLWQDLPDPTEGLSPEQWMQSNFDRFIILKGFELLNRPLEKKLKNALLDIHNLNKRKNLIQIWQDMGNNPISKLENPKYELLKNMRTDKRYSKSLWKDFRLPIKKALIIAHRGGYSQFPENSLSAFQHAYSLRVDGIECDLRLSSDGIVFILHDNNLEFVAGVKSNVNALSSKQLLSLKLRDPFHQNKRSNESPLTLENLLKEYGGKMLLWLELKHDGGKSLPEKVGDLLEQYNLVHQVIVSSFSSDMLKELRIRFPELIVAYEFEQLKEKNISPLLTAPDKHRLVISADHPEIFTPEILTRLVKARMSTSSYTPDRFDAIQRALDYNVRFIQTNRPERAVLLRQRRAKISTHPE